jgi:hypothetical protein
MNFNGLRFECHYMIRNSGRTRFTKGSSLIAAIIHKHDNKSDKCNIILQCALVARALNSGSFTYANMTTVIIILPCRIRAHTLICTTRMTYIALVNNITRSSRFKTPKTPSTQRCYNPRINYYY